MNEFDYEILQRKRLSQQAKHKKNGSKSKKCSLPSDGMSHKEWKERNGEVMSYNRNKPMTYSQFKKLPKDLQEDYIKHLQSTYIVSQKDVAEMLGVEKSAFCTYCKKRELNVWQRVAITKKHTEEWRRFCTGE